MKNNDLKQKAEESAKDKNSIRDICEYYTMKRVII